jgi:hypothetical protein
MSITWLQSGIYFEIHLDESSDISGCPRVLVYTTKCFCGPFSVSFKFIFKHNWISCVLWSLWHRHIVSLTPSRRCSFKADWSCDRHHSALKLTCRDLHSELSQKVDTDTSSPRWKLAVEVKSYSTVAARPIPSAVATLRT